MRTLVKGKFTEREKRPLVEREHSRGSSRRSSKGKGLVVSRRGRAVRKKARKTSCKRD